MAICMRTLEVCLEDGSISTLLLIKNHWFINLHYDNLLDLGELIVRFVFAA